MRLGIIARMDKTGLGNQTRNLVYMLNPDKILLIDSEPFNGNKQYPKTYKKYQGKIQLVHGFPSRAEVREFLNDIDKVLTCETFYSDYLIALAKSLGIKTINQFNYEFLDYLNRFQPMCDMLVAPSKWHLGELEMLFSNIAYLPPPIDENQFKHARVANENYSGPHRFLHIVGKQAMNDRNGTLTVLESLKHTKSNFELVIKSQQPIEYDVTDPRIRIDYDSPENEASLYEEYDALIMPRRYGGLCLPMNEALLSGLPVFMTDVEPNNYVLPDEWLIPASIIGEFQTRSMIDIYEGDSIALAAKIDWAINNKEYDQERVKAYEIGSSNFANYNVQSKWKALLESV